MANGNLGLSSINSRLRTNVGDEYLPEFPSSSSSSSHSSSGSSAKTSPAWMTLQRTEVSSAQLSLRLGIRKPLQHARRSRLFQQEVYDYCDPKLKLCEVFTDHTMCKYPLPGLSPQCTSAIHEPLSETEKKRILFWHNKFRSNVANGTEKNKSRKLPTSSNMRQIYWDNELETIAERWAEQCTKTTAASPYDKCRNTRRFQVSQNVGTRQVNGTTIDKQAPLIVITWYKESKDFDPALVDKFVAIGDDKIFVKQFANIIWADTYAIGCGRVIFQEQLLNAKDSKLSIRAIERLVCNYGPGGNEIGKPIYKRGASCENCPSGTQCSRVFPGLCATQSAEKLESQDSKDDLKSETEISMQELELTSDSSVTEKLLEEPVLEEEQESKIMTSVFPESTTGFDEVKDECEGNECLKRISTSHRTTMDPIRRFDEIIRFEKPSARKKSREVGIAVPTEKDDIILEKRKWIVSNSKKVKRSKSEEKLKNGDTCKCYIEIQDENHGSSRACKNIFLIFFSAFIAAVEPFLFSISFSKQ